MSKRILLFLAMMLASATSNAYQSCDIQKGYDLVNNPAASLASVNDILEVCDKISPNNARVLVLHGLAARRAGVINKQFQVAIDWFKKALLAEPNNTDIAIELAVTYEWASQFENAKVIYQTILTKLPDQRAALLGMARVNIAENQLASANTIYQKLLATNQNDVDALNGLARIQLVKGNITVAKDLYNQSLAIKPLNPDAMTGLNQIYHASLPATSTPTSAPTPTANVGIQCDAANGLILLNQPHPRVQAIKRILYVCDLVSPDNEQVLLLHGLLARKEGIPHKQFQSAITWLKKASAVSSENDYGPRLELAVTYEWAKQFDKAQAIYADILTKKPQFKPALLGLARTFLATHQIAKASQLFKQVLKLEPNNADALLGLKQVAAATTVQSIKVIPACNANEGLKLLNQPQPPYTAIDAILAKCDKTAPNDVQTLLLHGLLARKEGMTIQQYDAAIFWLQNAMRVAAYDNPAPALELAVTYEWAGKPAQAKMIYDAILWRDPNSKPALLGLGRVYLQTYQIKKAKASYEILLQKDPNDVAALTGMGWVLLANKEFTYAREDFEKALLLHPDNTDATIGLQQLANTTRYLLIVNGGKYTVGGTSSKFGSLNLFADINATDQIILQFTHNSNEIELGLVLDPTLLPKNTALIGFQHQLPNQYGWGLNYEYRERTKFNVENRIGANGNVYLLPQLQWLIGAREGFPSPWNNQLFYSGLTLFTSLPVNFSVTGFWGHQQTGGGTAAYSFDLSKEFVNRAFYNAGASYSPSQESWELHGRLILPVTKNQALEATYEHNYFNGLSYYNLGWRFYW